MDQTWREPVRIVTKSGDVVDVDSARQAADILVIGWPGPWGSRAHLAAQAACLDVIEEKRSPDDAREAFLAAAKEADILAD